MIILLLATFSLNEFLQIFLSSLCTWCFYFVCHTFFNFERRFASLVFKFWFHFLLLKMNKWFFFLKKKIYRLVYTCNLFWSDESQLWPKIHHSHNTKIAFMKTFFILSRCLTMHTYPKKCTKNLQLRTFWLRLLKNFMLILLRWPYHTHTKCPDLCFLQFFFLSNDFNTYILMAYKCKAWLIFFAWET